MFPPQCPPSLHHHHHRSLPGSFFRQFVADVEIITLDSNGRFLIPKRYLKLASIEQEVRFIGMDSTIEIWAKETTEKPFMDPEEFEKELAEIMGIPDNK